jgi:hypothetical protein
MKKITKALIVTTFIVTLNVACKKKEEEPKPSPEVKTVTPVAGIPGEVVTLKGAALGGNPEATKVAFNDIEASIISINDDSIVVKIPDNAIKGQNQLTVKVDGEVIQGGTVPFTITFPPKITSLSVAKGRIGAYVTLTVEELGTTDLNALTVKFGDIQAPKLSLDANKIDVIAPVPAVSGDKVKVTVVVGGLKSKGMDFEYEVSPTAPEEIPGVPQSGTNQRPVSLFFNSGYMYAFGADNPITFKYESFLLKPNSAAWEKVNEYYASHTVVVGDYAFLASKFQILKLNIKTGETSIHVGADNPKIAPHSFFGSIAADKASNLYLVGYITKEILKISSTTGSVDVLPGFDFGANVPLKATVINDYLFIVYNNGNVYKYNLTTQGPSTLLCNSAFTLVNGMGAYKGQIYIVAGTLGLKRIDPETGVITDVTKAVDARVNFYIDQDTGIMYYINRTNFRTYRYYLN